MAAIEMTALVIGDVTAALLNMEGNRGELRLVLGRWDGSGSPTLPNEDAIQQALEAELGRAVRVSPRGGEGHGPDGRHCDVWQVEAVTTDTVTHVARRIARRIALHDLATTLSQGEDPEGLAWGPEHTTSLARRMGSSVDALIDAVGEDTWAELIGAAQNAYHRWMQTHADCRELRAEPLTDGWSVVDGRGGRWWPSDDAQEQIAAAKDPAYAALRGCISDELDGEWRS